MFDALPSSGIYMIRNAKDGKYYIGSAVSLSKRRKEHFNALRAGRHFNRHLQAAWSRDGEASFSFFVLAFVADKALLTQVEQGYIDSYQAHKNRNGYNSRPKAESNLGHVFSDETREKVRRANIGKRQSPETIAKRAAAMKGRRPSALALERARLAKLGVPRADIAQWAPEKFRQFDDRAVAAIRADRESGMTYCQLAIKHGCLASTAHRVVNRTGVAYA